MAIQQETCIEPGDLPRHIDTILQIRTGKVKPEFVTSEPSGIYKTPVSKPIKVSFKGCEGDEHFYPPHQSPDNALLHYASQHYLLWQSEIPSKSHLFYPGAFGENLVSSYLDENTVCIGDVMQVGKDLLIQVTKPRSPCYKLEYRFEVKDMNVKSSELHRTGWLYRILKEGEIGAGDKIILVERRHPKWTIANVQKLLNKDLKNDKAMQELASLPELGQETKEVLKTRIAKRELLKKGKKQDATKWKRYRLVQTAKETSRISSFVFESLAPDNSLVSAMPGAHIRVKLGEKGELARAYSVVSGDSNQFTLGIAFDKETSRGGSRFMHEEVQIGNELQFSEIKSDFQIVNNAQRHILIAGGIGITAFLLMTEKLVRQNADFHFYYAVRSSSDIAFKSNLERLPTERLTILDASQKQRLDIPAILQDVKGSTHIYICGPERLTSAVVSTAQSLTIPSSHIHFEAFAASTTGDPFTVELAESKKTLEVKSEQTLLDVLRDAGLDVPSSCEVGNCGTCKVAVKCGRVEHRGTGLGKSDKGEMMLSCVSRGIGEIVLVL
ncbi:hypothetical protein G7Y89_g6155 [Cudoniella acicularis]|uniref:Uncharacterized protein n=1 Tax=Cudoniella acicularis TaxID=354080 RepID=A0A8H4W5T3_9HELO|nr:hypothetical protein G7Y89_g6155 [Cudoniella acicularis]